MRYLTFNDGIPVTGIPIIDETLLNKRKADAISRLYINIVHNGENFSIYLDIFNMVVTIPMGRNIAHFMKYEINYDDVEMFDYVINNSDKLVKNINGASVKFYGSSDKMCISVSNVMIIVTDQHKKMPFDEFMSKSESVLESLIDDVCILTDRKSLSEMSCSYDAAMSCRMKRAN